MRRAGGRATPLARCRRTSVVCYLMAMALSVATLVGWAYWVFATGRRLPRVDEPIEGLFLARLIGADANPMSWRTATGLLLLGVGLHFHTCRPRSRAGRWWIAGAATGVGLWAGCELVFRLVFRPDAPDPTAAVLRALQSWHAYRMSSLTDLMFLLSAAALGLLGRGPGRRLRAAAGAAAVAVAVVSLLVLSGFLVQHKLFENLLGTNGTVAFPTALAFGLFGVALVAAVGPRQFLLRHWIGNGTAARLMRAFLPTCVAAVLVGEIIGEQIRRAMRPPIVAQMYSDYVQEHGGDAGVDFRVLFVSVWAYFVAAVVGALVVRWAGKIGGAIDRVAAQRDRILRELEEARDRERAATAAKDLFLAQVSHELRTPLNHVLGYCQLLEMTLLNDGQRQDLGKVRSAGDHLLGLINDILDFQKIILGNVPLELDDFEIGPWVEEVGRSMEGKVAEKGNRLAIDCPPDLGTVRSDRKRVRQVLINLLSNAAKFTRGGTISVLARREAGGDGGWIVLQVADTGKGMTPEQQARLFRPFEKFTDQTDNPEGTGLGLVISKNLCQLMGGDLTCTSTKDQGSTFCFRIPAVPTAATESSLKPFSRPPTPPGSAGRRRRPAASWSWTTAPTAGKCFAGCSFLRATRSKRPRTVRARCAGSARRRSTWCCSTSSCPTWTASRSSNSSRPGRSRSPAPSS